MKNMDSQKCDRLISIREALSIVGLKSETSLRKLVADGELPPLIKRGRNSLLLESDAREYVSRLAKTREAA